MAHGQSSMRFPSCPLSSAQNLTRIPCKDSPRRAHVPPAAGGRWRHPALCGPTKGITGASPATSKKFPVACPSSPAETTSRFFVWRSSEVGRHEPAATHQPPVSPNPSQRGISLPDSLRPRRAYPQSRSEAEPHERCRYTCPGVVPTASSHFWFRVAVLWPGPVGTLAAAAFGRGINVWSLEKQAPWQKS